MKKARKFLSLLLAVMMVMGLVPAMAESALTDGVYVGTGKGMHSNIEVSVTVTDGKIADVTVNNHGETAGVSDPAIEQIPAAIVAANSADVDAVAGATLTSNGIMEAVKNALSGKTEEQSTELTIEPDMIVVGSGMAGLVATARGVELGLKVLVLEESVRTGGCIHYAGGTISGAGFKIQQENGVEDTPEAFYADIEALGGEGEFNKPLAKMHTERAKDAIDWLDEDLKVDFGDPQPGGRRLYRHADPARDPCAGFLRHGRCQCVSGAPERSSGAGHRGWQCPDHVQHRRHRAAGGG